METGSGASGDEIVGPQTPRISAPRCAAGAATPEPVARPSTSTEASSSGGADTGDHDISARIDDLKKLQAEMNAAKKRAAKNLKNLQRKKSRLCGKAKQLTDEDLLQVLKLRQLKAAKKEEKTQEAGSGAAPVGTDTAPLAAE